ncbi:MAG: S-layer homology domain-containing protein [Clostridia bacterium]|nr:S-layer homology domain-containing protein [Clostridia bacterium]
MKRITALLLCALTILTALPMTAFGGYFEDVADGKWYSEGISFCAANGYMNGTSENVFDRNSTLTRAMFMTILAKIDGADLTPYENSSSFVDVRGDAWYSAAIEWACQNNLANGIGNNEFGYKRSITREQIAMIFYSYVKRLNEKNGADDQIDLSPSADLSVFKDADRVHQYATEQVSWAVGAGLLSGIGEGYLDPRGNCTRAQAAVLIRTFVLTFLSDCEHEWTEPTCTEAGECINCDLNNRAPLGHDFADRPCSESVKCSRCDEISPAKEHNFSKATCTEPSVCLNCGIENAPAKGHYMLPATYALPARCQVCGYTDGTAIAHTHKFAGMTCEGRGVCLLCRKFCAPLGHTTSNGYCSREGCGKPIFATAHNQVVYHINKDGTQEGVYKYIYEDDVMLTLIPGRSEVYVVYETTNSASDLTYRFEMLLPNSTSNQYEFVSYCYDDTGYYYAVSGRVNTSGYSDGEFILTGYQGSEGIKEVALGLTSNYLPKMILQWSRAMNSMCGVNCRSYGFND